MIDPGGRSWHGRGMRQSSVGGHSIWSQPARQSPRSRGCWKVSDQSIYTWRRQELIDRGELPGLSSEEREELRAARLRIRELETELAVHRRAAELLKEEVRPKDGLR